MTSIIPWSFINTDSVIDEEKRIKVKKNRIKWEMYIPEEDRRIISLVEQEFQYPSLDDLRMQFKATGLYTDKQINEIIKVYERLPKYKSQLSSVARGTKRS